MWMQCGVQLLCRTETKHFHKQRKCLPRQRSLDVVGFFRCRFHPGMKFCIIYSLGTHICMYVSA
jgi:hypothetical protein